MCGGVHYGEVEGLVSVERWSCRRGAHLMINTTEVILTQVIHTRNIHYIEGGSGTGFFRGILVIIQLQEN